MSPAFTRRRVLVRAATAAAAALSSSALSSSALLSPAARSAPEPPTTLRFLRLRARTLLVDLDGKRVLVDPCTAPDLGAAALYDAPPASIPPEEVGDVDVLCVTSREPGAFDGETTRRLRGRTASCFVPDEETAKVLRFQGYRRVRVVVPGDVFETNDVMVRMSPSRSLFGGAGVGFHLERKGRTLWHAGSPPPLDVAEGSAQFAREHPAEVAAASASGLSFGGAQRTVDREDALLLAGLCKARYAVFLEDDVKLSFAGRLVLKSDPGSRRLPAGVRTRPIVVEEGRWYRVLGK